MKNDKRPFLILLLLFLLPACSLLIFPIYTYQQFLHLNQHDDTQIITQEWRRIFSPPLCLLTIQQQQKLLTYAPESQVWNRVATIWDQQPGHYFGQHDEAYYQHHLLPSTTIHISVFAQNSQPNPIFIVNNHLTIDLPPRLCHPFQSNR